MHTFFLSLFSFLILNFESYKASYLIIFLCFKVISHVITNSIKDLWKYIWWYRCYHHMTHTYRYLVNSKMRKLLPTQKRKELISSIVKRLSKYHNGVKIFLNEYSQLHTTQLSRDLHQEIMSFMKSKKKIGDISGASKSKCFCKNYFYPLWY